MSTIDPMMQCSQTMRGNGAHPSPYFKYTQAFTPRRLKELFKFCEYLFYNSPHIYAALRKFGEYPITEVTYETTNTALRTKYEYLLEKVIRIRELLIVSTLDKYVYGNSFVSLYQPFVRYLKCPHCGSRTNIQSIDYKFSVRALRFSYVCMQCKKQANVGTDNVIDQKLVISRKLNFIRWDPKDMDIDHNPITNESIYYYTIPRELVQQVNGGHKTLIDTLPMGFLKAISANKKFRFAKGAIYHMKVGGPAGICSQWGLPPLLSVLSKFHYTEILRKANEAIALDHLVPFRIIHPAQASSNADPVVQISLQKWQDSMKSHMMKWRQDPLHVMYAPIPIGMTQVGGQGRALLTLGEVQEAEKNIVAALGIPMEFLYGGLTGTGMEATLRLIENQLETHINDILDLQQWATDKAAKFLGWELLTVGMTKFRIVDDNNAKQVVLNLWMQGQSGGAQVVSNQTVAELFDIDLDQEEERIKQETLDQVRRGRDIENEVMSLQNNLAEQARQEAMQGTGLGYNQQAVLSTADQKVEELLGVDEGTRRSMLHQLQMEDYVLYSVVIQRLEQSQNTMQRDVKAQVKNQEGMM